MAPSRTAFLLCSLLTVHNSLLAVLLHHSRTRQPPFRPSTAIFFTECGKILVSLAVVSQTGELRNFVKERRRLKEAERSHRLAEEERRTMDRDAEQEQVRLARERDWDDSDKRGGAPNRTDIHAGRAERPTVLHQRTPSSNLVLPKNIGLSINVDRAQSFVPATPSLAIIPPTPAPEPSPTRIPEITLLFPLRPSRRREEWPTGLVELRDREWWETVRATVFGRGSSSVAIVAGLYALQNQAQYAAATNLSVPLFQLAYQLKIPATAMCSVILLNRSLSTQQWISLFALTFGVGLVQLCSVMEESSPLEEESSSASQSAQNHFWGTLMVVCASLSSGFASCYFERLLKIPSAISPPSPQSSPPPPRFSAQDCTSPTLPSSTPPLGPELPLLVPAKPSLWIRNIQLSIFGLMAGSPFVFHDLRTSLLVLLRLSDNIANDLDEPRAIRLLQGLRGVGDEFLQGFASPAVWLVILLQITGGLLSALVMQHADNLLKCFATSLAILLSLVASVVLFDFTITPGIAFGSTLVLAATLAYTSVHAFQQLLTLPLAFVLRFRQRRTLR
ncbi:hypothetical protein JCM16303_003781 [Sporobolomyces ruberrimus]